MLWLEGSDDPWNGGSAGSPAEAGFMTASEQMYFLGAPLAHVLHYEEELRDSRLRRSANLRQARRIIS